jgi:hypothetical protein
VGCAVIEFVEVEAVRNSGNWRWICSRGRCSRLFQFRRIDSRALITYAIGEL